MKLFFPGEDDNDFAFNFFLLEVGEYVGEGAAGGLGVEFADFAAHGDLSVGVEGFDKLFQQLHQPVRALVDNHRAFLVSEGVDGCLATFLMRQEAEENEAVAGQAAVYQCRHESCGTWQTFHFNTFLHRLAYQ